MKTLYLASASTARQQALDDAKIPYQIITHTADERSCDPYMPFPQLLQAIAELKMEHVQLPAVIEQQHAYVLTADTMVQDMHGNIYGKPVDKENALAMIYALRARGRVGTAFCLDRKKFQQGKWVVDQRIVQFFEAYYELDLPDAWIERYLEHKSNYLSIAGAIDIKDYGQQFIKRVEGSYGTVVSLPLFYLRQALEQVGFFE